MKKQPVRAIDRINAIGRPAFQGSYAYRHPVPSFDGQSLFEHQLTRTIAA
jgi:hypothetical protein